MAEVTAFDPGLSRDKRWQKLNQRGLTLWFTGLPASGKSTLASSLYIILIDCYIPAYFLDGDNLRLGLNRDLGFDRESRAENLRRAGELCIILNDAGLITLASFVSPYEKDRAMIKKRHETEGLKYIEVYVSTPLAICEARDKKGLYKKARANLIENFTGISDPYEAPVNPDINVNLENEQDLNTGVDACYSLILKELKR
jgi:adenylyl-sulfate kinase